MANKIMSRPFAPREKVMLLILSIILIIAFYYFGVVKHVADAQAANDAQLETIEMQTEAQRALADEYAKMQERLDEMGSFEDLPVIAPYDNARRELEELNTILAQATTYSLSFEDPTLDGTTVRRVVKITFEAPSYDAAFGIIDLLQNGSYRSQVNDIAMTGNLLTNGEAESVSTTLTVTFFETTNGSTNTSGLIDSSS